MKKSMIALCLMMGCCYGMQQSNQIASSVLSTETSAGIPMQSLTPVSPSQVTPSTGNTPTNLNVKKCLTFEGKCWYIIGRMIDPLQVVSNVATTILGSVSAAYADSNSTVSKNSAIAMAVTGGVFSVLSIFKNKINNRVNSIDKALDSSNQNGESTVAQVTTDPTTAAGQGETVPTGTPSSSSEEKFVKQEFA